MDCQVCDIVVFNPRLREGGDSQYINGSHKPSVFNPRLREGGDPMEENGMSLINFSIHASAKEATDFFRYFGD